MIRQYSTREDYNILKCTLSFLSSMLVLSYLPGFFSYVSNENQPCLIKLDLWATCINTINIECASQGDLIGAESILLGWHKAYSVFDESHSKLKEVDNDLQKAGFAYLILSFGSLVVFMLSFGGLLCKSKCLSSFLMLISWVMLLVSMIIYIVEFQDEVIQETLKEMKDDFSTFVDVEWKWRFGSGLICNIFGLVLMPAISCMI